MEGLIPSRPDESESGPRSGSEWLGRVPEVVSAASGVREGYRRSDSDEDMLTDVERKDGVTANGEARR